MEHNAIKTGDSFLKKNHLSIKVILIGITALLMLIPLQMIQELVRDRESSAEFALDEVSQMWSDPQVISGPVLDIPLIIKDADNLSLLPESLVIDGTLGTETLKRSIYDVIVYRSTLTINGSFIFPKDLASKSEFFRESEISLVMGLSDLRGIEEQAVIEFDGVQYPLSSGLGDVDFQQKIGTKVKLNKTKIESGEPMEFLLTLKLKGSRSLKFTPVGNQTEVHLSSNYTSPSFDGNYLPSDRSVSESGFKADWKVLGMNRNYAQVLESSSSYYNKMQSSNFGVRLIVPVTQYQQTTRSIKYAILILVLIFVASFIVEIATKKKIHIIQYFIAGLAIVLFYSILLSLSEYISFGWSYLIAAIMTISLISGYFIGILKSKYAYVLALLLILLYSFIYILLQMETYALLVGSLGLFVILGVIMYFTRKIA